MRSTALITGASGGIGRELARQFAAGGHDLVLVARQREKLRALARELESEYDVVTHALPADLSRRGAPQALLRSVERRGLSVDVLVNNAAVLQNGDFADTPLASLLLLLQLNVMATTALTHCFLQPMLGRGYGRVLNVASIAAFQPLVRVAAYAAAKAYLLHLTEALAEELAGTGVTATVLCPGYTDTDMMAGAPDSAWVPSFAISSAAQVARDGYEACMRGTPVYVSGATNQLITQLIRWQPRWLVRSISGAVSRRSR